ncbi:MAG TPA: prepilin-type N-terminal cleavage/methylation domain-containing protein [Planctomycetota bacterium]
MKRRAGFTLIELTVVLAVVVVLSGFLVLRVSGWTPRQSLNASARAFGGALGVWRERARFDETTYRVAWKERAWSVTSSADERVSGGTLGFGQTFEEAGELVFDRRGVADPRAIGLRHKSGDRVAVVVDALLSGVKYE